MSHNPRRGHTHYKCPSRIFWRTVRGMLPYKTQRGAASLARLKCFEGMPTPFDQKKRQVVPAALKVLRLKQFRPHCILGDLSTLVGWKKGAIVDAVEKKRKDRSLAFYQRKIDLLKKRKQASGHKDFADLKKKLAQFGY
mmetsp:Transcript_26035/g.22930  ORF Transcript_26035/g.22930 Transcript_26035/m.22930 type:complete len:139 (+) Transcript_26035:245-661(+)